MSVTTTTGDPMPPIFAKNDSLHPQSNRSVTTVARKGATPIQVHIELDEVLCPELACHIASQIWSQLTFMRGVLPCTLQQLTAQIERDDAQRESRLFPESSGDDAHRKRPVQLDPHKRAREFLKVSQPTLHHAIPLYFSSVLGFFRERTAISALVATPETYPQIAVAIGSTPQSAKELWYIRFENLTISPDDRPDDPQQRKSQSLREMQNASRRVLRGTMGVMSSGVGVGASARLHTFVLHPRESASPFSQSQDPATNNQQSSSLSASVSPIIFTPRPRAPPKILPSGNIYEIVLRGISQPNNTSTLLSQTTEFDNEEVELPSAHENDNWIWFQVLKGIMGVPA
ncbi:hypothetical protein M427DRAFT_42273 [Gonapodya prolifera JEL478]|uniref:Uncharacterized protein n=1 Tax=Gonapodya prolifera (strain JEL478) TaxID=1344416 RepID=A0A139AP83_GONPJ|nr:hypothetical protein M427DRAFT_42273 [Gonapodya prolifera JEL478]|eukprot:KXS18546.1 hypothetical protein M427DRAFT_42273 [Gonapodya prolifera JEL478]